MRERRGHEVLGGDAPFRGLLDAALQVGDRDAGAALEADAALAVKVSVCSSSERICGS
jgi:hypothetical protein